MSSLVSGRAVVPTPGTAVRLSTTSVAVHSVTIRAETDNTNPVTIGGSDVVGAVLTRKGVALAPTDPPITLEVDELSDIYVDAVTATEGVTYFYSPA